MSENSGVGELIPPRCKCGCGLFLKRYRGKYPQYIKGHFSKKYHFDRTLFASIDTEPDAYWLGFLFADGYVKDERGVFGFNLGLKDVEHLRKFKTFAGATHPIRIADRYCALEISAKHYIPTLQKYGLVQGKSAHLLMPELAPELRAHFVRGVFDGDGWISFYARTKSLSFGIIGSIMFLNSIQITLIEECDLSWTKLYRDKRHSEGYGTLAYGGNGNCLKLFDYLYEGATVFLERKYEIWVNHLPLPELRN